MKKVLVLLAVICLSAGSSFAQKGKMYLGTTAMTSTDGSFTTGLNFAKAGETKTNVFGLAPEFGYFVSDKFSIGLGAAVNFSSVKVGDGDAAKTTTWGVNPYARYYMCSADKFSFYLQGGLSYSSSKAKDVDAENILNIGILPGISYCLSDKFAINASFGSLGYTKYAADDTNEFGLKLDMSSLKFGVTYSF